MCRTVIISVCCLEHDLEETVALLRALDTHKPTSDEYEGNDDTEEETPSRENRRDRADNSMY